METDGLTFKDLAKRELLDVLPSEDCCVRAFLSAVSRLAGSIEISARRVNLCLRLDSYEVALKLTELFKKLYPTDIELSVERQKNPKNAKQVCVLRVPMGFAKQALSDFELMREEDGSFFGFVQGMPQDLLRKECCKKAYFKGLFLAGGGVYVPDVSNRGRKKEGYHFEICVEDGVLADDVMELMSDLRINTRMSERRDLKLVYAKDKDDVLAALATLDLAESVLRLKAIIDDREAANVLNRTIICETANLDKTYSASSRQMIAIAKLRSNGLFDSLPAQLKLTAQMRGEYPETSLNDLAAIMGVTKSCLSHRLNKLEQLADEIE